MLKRELAIMAAVTSHTLDDVLNDLCTRFLINIPDEDLQDGIRIFFVIEQAHWFYDVSVLKRLVRFPFIFAR